MLKFFPAALFGGPATLKHYAAVFPKVKFVPTGGIEAAQAKDYFALPNVAAVGGSWVTPRDAVAARDWKRIASLAQQAVSQAGR